jgi:hypothetical protein
VLNRHAESSGVVSAPVERVFAYLDDHERLSSHMSRSSWKMGGGSMRTVLDEAMGRSVGSTIRLEGTVFGLRLFVEEVVVERVPPNHKAWQTVGTPRLLVIGAYRMRFEVMPSEPDSRVRVLIDYALPETGFARWLGHVFGGYYAHWCTRRMVVDARTHFAASRGSLTADAPVAADARR